MAEAVATGGLLLVVFGVARSGRSSVAPFAVGAYIGAAYWFTASTSFANPAVAIARAFSNTFAGIEPSSVPAFVSFQIIGAAFAVVLVRYLYPDVRAVAGDVIVPPIEGVVSTMPEILYVCIHNSGRSVAAAVLTDHYARGRVHVRSAGSQPGSAINGAVAQVLRERGLDPDNEFPKPLTDEAARAADVIITMGCGDACPVYPGKRYLDWEITDPADKTVENEAKNGLKNDKYTIAMARTMAPHSASAQFFINTKNNDFLNYPGQDGWGYAVFGKVVEGQDVVDQINAVKTSRSGMHSDVPVDPVVIEKVEVVQ